MHNILSTSIHSRLRQPDAPNLHPLLAQLAPDIIFVNNLAAINESPPQHNPDFTSMGRLLEWRDPVSGQQLNLPIDRTASLEQVDELLMLQLLDLIDN